MTYMKYTMSKIDIYRTQRNMTAGEMAEIMGIGRDCYFRWLKDPSLVRAGALDRACAFLKVDSAILTDDNIPITLAFNRC